MHSQSSQKGAGLILFFLVLIIAGSVFLLTHTPPDQGRVSGANATSTSLAKAKSALLSYAVSYYLLESTSGISHQGIHGLLPCPERPTGYNGEGNSSNQCGTLHTNSLGRLPWKNLDIEPLKDGTGECLWYAVSGGFYNTPRSPMTNDDTPGMFQVYNQNGSITHGATPEDRVVAVVIAPGGPLSGQNRGTSVPGNPCKFNGDTILAANFLDNLMGINNADVNEVSKDTIDAFIQDNGLKENTLLNDRIITITAGEIFDAIKSNDSYYSDKIQQLGLELGQCLIDYAESVAITPASCPSLEGCDTDCENAYAICMASASTKPEENVCKNTRKTCLKSCKSDCKGTGKPPKGPKTKKGPPVTPPGGGGGGGSVTYYRLPWPAPVDLAADYRVNSSYIDQSDATNGYLGRLPYDISNSSTTIGIPSTDNIFIECDLATLNPELYDLWQHWKDHWFYVVGEDFAPTASSDPPDPCTECPSFDGGTRYAAILLFSGERQPYQLRRVDETETPDPAFADSKANIANYLEGTNDDNYQDATGNGNYNGSGNNERLFCIEADMSTVSECTP